MCAMYRHWRSYVARARDSPAACVSGLAAHTDCVVSGGAQAPDRAMVRFQLSSRSCVWLGLLLLAGAVSLAVKAYSIEAPAKRRDREWMARFTAAATFEERRELLKQKPASPYHAWNDTKNTKIAAAALAVMALGAFGFALKRRGQPVDGRDDGWGETSVGRRRSESATPLTPRTLARAGGGDSGTGREQAHT